MIGLEWYTTILALSTRLPVRLHRFRRFATEMLTTRPPESRVRIESERVRQFRQIAGAVFKYAPGYLDARPCYVFSGRSSYIAVRRNFACESVVEAMSLNAAFFDYILYGQGRQKKVLMNIPERHYNVVLFRMRGICFEEVFSSFFYDAIVKYFIIKFV